MGQCLDCVQELCIMSLMVVGIGPMFYHCHVLPVTSCCFGNPLLQPLTGNLSGFLQGPHGWYFLMLAQLVMVATVPLKLGMR